MGAAPDVQSPEGGDRYEAENGVALGRIVAQKISMFQPTLACG